LTGGLSSAGALASVGLEEEEEEEEEGSIFVLAM
jgi:hypothetical protein